VLLVVAAAAWFATPALASFPGGNGRIAFSSNADGDFELFTMNPDGSGRTQITHNSFDEQRMTYFNDVAPKWSPSGDKLLFIQAWSIPALTAVDDLFTVNPDGTGEQRLFGGGLLADIGWSPDGDRIVLTACTAFGHGSCFGYNAFTSNRDANDFTRLAVNDGRSDLDVDWSSGGDKIAISDAHDIWIVAADGSPGVTPLVTGPALDADPSWSPDGRKLAFTSDRDGNDEIYVVNADGTGQTRLTHDARFDGAAAWSPDGRRIAFHRFECNESRCVSNILTMASDGSDEVQLTSNTLDSGAAETGPDWQPLPGPQRSDYKNRAQFCKAERAFWGEDGFRARYGGGANAHGKCVSSG